MDFEGAQHTLSNEDVESTRADAKKNTGSCAGCRRRHMKCHGDGVNACPSCVSQGDHCTYPKRKRAGPRAGWLQEREQVHQSTLQELESAKERIRELEARLSKYEPVLQHQRIEVRPGVPVEELPQKEIEPVTAMELNNDKRVSTPFRTRAKEELAATPDITTPLVRPVTKRRRTSHKVHPQEHATESQTQLVTWEPLQLKREPSDNLDLERFFDAAQGTGFSREPSWKAEGISLSQGSSWRWDFQEMASIVDEEPVGRGAIIPGAVQIQEPAVKQNDESLWNTLFNARSEMVGKTNDSTSCGASLATSSHGHEGHLIMNLVA